MSEQTTFSVIVPIYNVEKYLKECIESIIGQTFGDFQLILIDDGSPDNCPAICDDYAKKDNRIMVIHKENEGLVRARETGILAASGKYICWVDGDDFVSKELLEYLYQMIQSHDEPDMICFDYYLYNEDCTPRLKASENNNNPIPGLYDKKRLEQEIYPYMLVDSRKRFATPLIYGSVWSKCFKRKLITAHYCKDPRIKQGEDAAFVYECIFSADTVFCSDKVLYYYRQLNNSMIHAHNRMYLDQCQLKINYLRAHTGILSSSLSQQVENLYVADVLMAMFRISRHHIPVFESRREVKEMFRRTGALQDIQIGKNIPFHIRIAIKMLRCHLYLITVLISRLIIALEK